MNVEQKFAHVATQMYLEPAEEIGNLPAPATAPCGIPAPPLNNKRKLGIYNAAAAGKTIPLLKTMLTSACERNCVYCPFQAGRAYRRVTFTPDEMAKNFDDMRRAKLVNGLFLSSGILRGGVTSQDKMLDTVEIIRRKYQFDGYIHLKIMPGAEQAQVERALQLANRLSINLEAPTTERLNRLAPKKQLIEELLKPLQWVETIRRSSAPIKAWNRRWASTVTQFVVGAAEESDLELMNATDYLYNKLRLRRVYFSAFRPIERTPLENLTAENPLRELRLYQASFLLRDYGYEMESLPFDDAGNLPLQQDPKQAWADQHLRPRPVELNKASRNELLRVPGIGTKGADAILYLRRQTKLHDISQLRKIGVQTAPLLPYILLNGRQPARQLALF